tara:strand:+ start:45 stop:239 length:195 start_codon:yes stop_codon:yes gene_type:complete
MVIEEWITRCDKCHKGTWYEKEQQCHCSYTKKEQCQECGHSEEVLDDDGCVIMERCIGTLRKID